MKALMVIWAFFSISLALGWEQSHTQTLAHIYPTDPQKHALEARPLLRLLPPYQRLEGRYLRVLNQELNPQSLTSLKAETQDFRFLLNEQTAALCPENGRIDHDCSNLNDVNVYFHVDKFAHEFWFEKMGFTLPNAITILTHAAMSNSFADWKTGYIYFGHGNALTRDNAKEDDTIYHEYTHLILAGLGFKPDLDQSSEALALHEGYADYFAATFTNTPRLGNWQYDCPPREACEGPPNDTEMRTLETDSRVWSWQFGNPSASLKQGLCVRYNPIDQKCKHTWNLQDQLHVWGVIWAGMLWELREELSAEVADRLIFESVRLLPVKNPRFKQAATALLKADHLFFKQKNNLQIRQVLANRGFEAVYTANETEITAEPRLQLNLMPHPSRGLTTLQVLGQPQVWLGIPYQVKVWDVLGREVWQTTAKGTSFTFSTAHWQAGFYTLAIEIEGKQYRKVFLCVN